MSMPSKAALVTGAATGIGLGRLDQAFDGDQS